MKLCDEGILAVLQDATTHVDLAACHRLRASVVVRRSIFAQGCLLGNDARNAWVRCATDAGSGRRPIE
jgi:hypothetical protein